MKLALYTVGPLHNNYSGVHTYSDVLIPFVNELKQRGSDITWLGIALDSRNDNAKLKELGIEYGLLDVLTMKDSLDTYPKTWDFVDASEFDALMCQPRPLTNVIENEILLSLIQRFLDAGKPVYCWEVDMFTGNFTEEMLEKVILLHPAEVGPGRFKTEIYFPFFTYERDFLLADKKERDIDFLFMGNVYGRQEQALDFFAPLSKAPFDKLVFGSWVADDARREFSSQFDDFEFAGSTEHWAAIPTMSRAKATLHIVPDFARDRGLMTARVFTSHMAKCLCFCDAKIVGAEKFFPEELIVKNGHEIIARWDYVMEHRDELLAKRDELLKDFSVSNRVTQFLQLTKKHNDA